MPRKNLGVAVGSGGLESLAFIPLLQYLSQHNFTPEVYIVCSGSAFLPFAHASGIDLTQIERLAVQYE